MRGYIAMVAVNSSARRKGLGTYVCSGGDA